MIRDSKSDIRDKSACRFVIPVKHAVRELQGNTDISHLQLIQIEVFFESFQRSAIKMRGKISIRKCSMAYGSLIVTQLLSLSIIRQFAKKKGIKLHNVINQIRQS